MMDFVLGLVTGVSLTVAVGLFVYALSVYRDNRTPRHKRSTYVAPQRGRHKQTV